MNNQQRIKFVDFTNGRFLVWLILSLVLLIVYLLRPFQFANQSWYYMILTVSLSINAILLLRSLVYRNYVQWTKSVIQLSLNPQKKIIIRFDSIKSFDFLGDKLAISIDKSMITREFDLSNIHPDDIQRLRSILEEYTEV
jgi:hypothetical protein